MRLRDEMASVVPALSKIQTRLRLRHLHLLTAISERSSLGAAAEAIGMTQPAASKSLKELEDLLGVPLFSREGRGLRSTPYGDAAIAFAKQVFDRLGELREDLVSIEKADIGRVRIGAVSATAPDLIARAILQLKATSPKLNLMLHVDTSDMLMQHLAQEKLDLCVGMIPDGWPIEDLDFEPLFEEGLSVITRPGHPATQKAPIGLRSLLDYAWFLHPPSSPMRRLTDHAFLRANAPLPANVVETSSILTTVSAVMRSDIVAILSTPVAKFYAERGAVQILPVEIERRWAPYGMIRNKGKRMTPALKVVIDAIREASEAIHAELDAEQASPAPSFPL